MISEEIDKEKEREMSRLISSLANILIGAQEEESVSGQVNESGDNNSKQHEKTLFSLLCLRISISCRLCCEGETDYKRQIAEDIDDAIEVVKNIEYVWEITDEVIDDVLDVLTIVCPEHKDIFSPFL